MNKILCWFDELSKKDVAVAGGKGANLGEMTRAGLPVPAGFVVAADAYRDFIDESNLRADIVAQLSGLDTDDRSALDRASEAIQSRIRAATVPGAIRSAIDQAYHELGRRIDQSDPPVAVRSSATMEDTEQASFAGMNRSYLNVRGSDDLIQHVKEVWVSLFSPRVIFYRQRLGLTEEPEIAVVVQLMVNSEKSGVAFSIDPASGDRSLMVIEAAFGLGEVVVGGQVEPDHYVVSKPELSIRDRRIGRKEFMLCRDEDGRNVRLDLPPEKASSPVLSDDEVRSVAELVQRDEAHYGAPQDVEWAIAGGCTFLVQSRPITGRLSEPEPGRGGKRAAPSRELVRGLGASPGRASGVVRLMKDTSEADRLRPGEILVTSMTAPDWVPFMKRASAIVTDSGGMTSHAAIVSRELGLPCIVGTRDATKKLQDGTLVTVDATAGVVLSGAASAVTGPIGGTAAPSVSSGPSSASVVTATKLLVNLGEPERAQEVAARNVDGVGLLRAEFMILSALSGVHPRRLIQRGQGDVLIERLAEQLLVFAGAFAPRPVVYRAMDFRTNEFRGLEGGAEFEPPEENPMIGYRGAYRYVREPDLFRLELEAIKRVRDRFSNLHLMIPFVRTLTEFRQCKDLIDGSGLSAQADFELWIMGEVPSVVHWLDGYASLGIAGVSIGSNDLTQLVLGIDRDSEVLSALFDERDHAVMATIESIITGCRRLGIHSSICGQAPSVYPTYAEQLVRLGIDSISVNPDAIERTRYNIAAAEQRLILDHARGSTRAPGT